MEGSPLSTLVGSEKRRLFSSSSCLMLLLLASCAHLKELSAASTTTTTTGEQKPLERLVEQQDSIATTITTSAPPAPAPAAVFRFLASDNQNNPSNDDDNSFRMPSRVSFSSGFAPASLTMANVLGGRRRQRPQGLASSSFGSSRNAGSKSARAPLDLFPLYPENLALLEGPNVVSAQAKQAATTSGKQQQAKEEAGNGVGAGLGLRLAPNMLKDMLDLNEDQEEKLLAESIASPKRRTDLKRRHQWL